MAIYLSSLIRAITAFHDLIENKIQNRQQQEEKEAKNREDFEKAEETARKKDTPATNGEITSIEDAEKAKDKKEEKK
jgi:26S proteasome regulatory subunit N8